MPRREQDALNGFSSVLNASLTRLEHTVEQSIHQAISSNVSRLVDSVLPILTPLPPSPTRAPAVKHTCSAQESVDLMPHLMEITHAVHKGTVESAEVICLQKEIIQRDTTCKGLTLENDKLRDLLELDRQQHALEFSEAKGLVATKDRQLDLLKQELLKRASTMDTEVKEKDKLHLRNITELQTTIASLQVELAVTKEQVKQRSSAQEVLQQQLDVEKARGIDLEKLRHTEAAVHQEREAVTRNLQAAQEVQKQEYVSSRNRS